MQQKPSNTAILVFIRNEREEAQVKLFHAQLGWKRQVEIVQRLNRHVVQLSRQTGMPVFVVKGAQQVGTTFGERFANAFESVFAAGYEHVIAVGNDCLELTRKHLKKSAALFATGNGIVLGPAVDGGAYIVGISQQAYEREAFLALPWRTEAVFDALVVYAQSVKTGCAFLPLASDFDDAADLRRLITQMTGGTRIASILYHLLFLKILQPVVEIFLIEFKFHSSNALRAPPSAL